MHSISHSAAVFLKAAALYDKELRAPALFTCSGFHSVHVHTVVRRGNGGSPHTVLPLFEPYMHYVLQFVSLLFPMLDTEWDILVEGCAVNFSRLQKLKPYFSRLHKLMPGPSGLSVTSHQ
jgi:hypothetical protein